MMIQRTIYLMLRLDLGSPAIPWISIAAYTTLKEYPTIEQYIIKVLGYDDK